MAAQHGGGQNIAIVKTDAAGNLQWNQTYGAGEGYSMTKTSDGGFAIAGTKLVKTDAAGNMQWSLSFEGDNSTNQAYSVIQTSDGGYAVAGSYAYAWLAKINPVTSTNLTAQPSRSSSPTPGSTLPSSSQTPSTSPWYSLSPNPSSSLTSSPSQRPTQSSSPSPSQNPTSSPNQLNNRTVPQVSLYEIVIAAFVGIIATLLIVMVTMRRRTRISTSAHRSLTRGSE